MEKIYTKIARYFEGGFDFGVFREDKGVFVKTGSTKEISFLRYMNAKGDHIFMRPRHEEFYMLVDDISAEDLARDHQAAGRWKPGRMVVESSPASFQVWIRARRPLGLTEKKYWLAKMGSDPGAAPKSRWGRAPGFRNRKEKHRTSKGYPLARLVWVDFRHRAFVPDIKIKDDSLSHLPQGGCVSSFDRSGIRRSDYNRRDESRTDFAFALALARRGATPGEIRERIIQERLDWSHHVGKVRKADYLNRTISRVINALRR